VVEAIFSFEYLWTFYESYFVKNAVKTSIVSDSFWYTHVGLDLVRLFVFVIVGCLVSFCLCVYLNLWFNLLGRRVGRFVLIVRLFKFIETEVGAVDDTIMFYCILFGGALWFFGCCVVYAYFGIYRSVFNTLFVVLLIFPIIVVGYLIKSYGLQVFQFFRGAAKTNFFLWELIFDVLAVVIGVIRSELQVIRLIVMFFFFCELYQFIYINQVMLWFVVAPSCCSVFWLCQWFSLLYYIVHCSIIYIFQVIVFVVIFFFLFFQFYSNFSGFTYEGYFIYKR
jgi:hypothetical protein